MQEHQEDRGGLFGDEELPQKRENPYKKKKKEKQAKEQADKPTPLSEDTPLDDTLGADGDPETSGKSSEGAARKRSLKDRLDDFLFAHVKLIVFIVGVTVVVMLLGPFSVFRIAEWVEDAQRQAEMEDKGTMSMTYVKGLCDKAEPITWRDVEKYYYEDRSSDTYCTWIIPVEGGYEVWMGGASTARSPDYVTIYDSDTGRKLDLTQGLTALEEFLE